VPDEQPAFEIALTVGGETTAGPEYAELVVPSTAPPAPRARSDWTPPRASAPVVSSGPPWWLAGGGGAVLVFAVVVLTVLRRRNARR
jgi:hypothetical protein